MMCKVYNINTTVIALLLILLIPINNHFGNHDDRFIQKFTPNLQSFDTQKAVLANTKKNSRVFVISIEGVINPLTAAFLNRVMTKAKDENIDCIIIELDTPGGLDQSMRDMTQAILNSPIPVVVYVAPSGARAASAGLFITLAGHVAAMAPGTNIGAAHPVGLGGGKADSVMIEKIVNDASATIRSIAKMRHRNVLWAEEAVRKSVSITDEEALEKGVIDLIAHNREELLEKINGKLVQTNQGQVILQIENSNIDFISMTLIEKFLHIITDPNIALLLLSLGLTAIIIEFYTPGSFGPAIVGVILLILGFMALGSLPVNWAGILLILLAAIFFVVELYTPTFGIFALGGIISFILGALILFTPFTPTSPSMPVLSVSPWLVIGLTAIFVIFFFIVMRSALRAQKDKPRSGMKMLVGATGIAKSDLNPSGVVFVQSELWKADSENQEIIKEGEQVEVLGYNGSILRVKKIPNTKINLKNNK